MVSTRNSRGVCPGLFGITDTSLWLQKRVRFVPVVVKRRDYGGWVTEDWRLVYWSWRGCMALVMASSLVAVVSSFEVRKCSTNFSMLSGRQNDPFGHFFPRENIPLTATTSIKLPQKKLPENFFYFYTFNFYSEYQLSGSLRCIRDLFLERESEVFNYKILKIRT